MVKNEKMQDLDGVVPLPHREKVYDFYQTNAVQYFIATVIIVNFIAIILEKEFDPYPVEFQRYYTTVWDPIDTVCNWIFLLELLINLYGNFWKPFIKNPWNYLDTIVVVIGVISLARVKLQPPASNIKILRAFRILRLFKRVKSLNKILVALLKSIPGVCNAFIVMLIFMMIFAIVAVDLFRDFGCVAAAFAHSRKGMRGTYKAGPAPLPRPDASSTPPRTSVVRALRTACACARLLTRPSSSLTPSTTAPMARTRPCSAMGSRMRAGVNSRS